MQTINIKNTKFRTYTNQLAKISSQLAAMKDTGYSISLSSQGAFPDAVKETIEEYKALCDALCILVKNSQGFIENTMTTFSETDSGIAQTLESMSDAGSTVFQQKK